MIRLELVKKDIDTIYKLFSGLLVEAFGEYNGELPGNIYLVYEDNKRIAFCSVYVHSRGNLYLQYIGFADGIIKKYHYFSEVTKELHKLGFPFIMGAINSKNKIALMWALRAGYEINGIRQATDGKLFVEIIHK